MIREALVNGRIVVGEPGNEKDAIRYLQNLKEIRLKGIGLLMEITDAYRQSLNADFIAVFERVSDAVEKTNNKIKAHENLYYIVNDGYGLN